MELHIYYDKELKGQEDYIFSLIESDIAKGKKSCCYTIDDYSCEWEMKGK